LAEDAARARQAARGASSEASAGATAAVR
jgi:hypothetical protein